jgi:hypothetical protein
VLLQLSTPFSSLLMGSRYSLCFAPDQATSTEYKVVAGHLNAGPAVEKCSMRSHKFDRNSKAGNSTTTATQHCTCGTTTVSATPQGAAGPEPAADVPRNGCGFVASVLSCLQAQQHPQHASPCRRSCCCCCCDCCCRDVAAHCSPSTIFTAQHQ